jgi:SAM-dependent methyltransferase
MPGHIALSGGRLYNPRPMTAGTEQAPPPAFIAATDEPRPLSRYARFKKIKYFLDPIARDARVLEIGCGAGWVADYFRRRGTNQYVGVDLFPPADIVGDIREWRALGLKPESFDYIIAFEVIEHVDLTREFSDLLKPGGRLLMTSPVPSMDWVLKMLEAIGMCQQRTSPHCNLIDFRKLPLFELVSLRKKAGLAQWGVFRKPVTAAGPTTGVTVSIGPGVTRAAPTRQPADPRPART